ncbi:glutathione S-transferase family protein [Aurantiacibacter sp. MUD11]|uniref:glutathione S-transferase family protein n=1 Tax=Aurantiacibacter sp. MUD11 TaxID=3003265 RepID=UPI0022AA0795|nr:glutathione S-transferase family protein [Aurantiacibacter sp. MUD11]WAT17374.1 glutathione S-transferase family protein [Aurantiacibacter sp. MUD11]
MYTLITANRNYSSWSLRPWLLMKALGIPFEDRLEPLTKPDNYADFRKFSPTGLVPLLIDGKRQVWDSLAIALYLAERHEGVWPKDDEARAFAQSAVCEMHSGFVALRNQCAMSLGVRVRMAEHDRALAKDVARIRELFEQGLDRFGGPWLAGAEFTVLDAFYAPVAYRVRTYGLDVGRGQAWVDHVIAHPAMQQWEAEGLAETWREVSHENEIERSGTLIADYRQG